MAGLIVNISAVDRSGRINADDLGKYLASIIQSALGEEIRVNVTRMDVPINRIQTYKNSRSAMNRPWMGRYGS